MRYVGICDCCVDLRSERDQKQWPQPQPRMIRHKTLSYVLHKYDIFLSDYKISLSWPFMGKSRKECRLAAPAVGLAPFLKFPLSSSPIASEPRWQSMNGQLQISPWPIDWMFFSLCKICRKNYGFLTFTNIQLFSADPKRY